MTARLGERQAPGGTGNEADTDLILKRRQMTADRGQGHAETAARRGQTAGLGNGNENIDGCESIHASFQKIVE